MSLFNNAYVQGFSPNKVRLAKEIDELTKADQVGCPDYNYELGLYVHVAGCDCARRDNE